MKSEDKTYVQCQQCGNIFQIDMDVGVDEQYINIYCSYCERTIDALNIGEDILDIYDMYNINVDGRFYSR